jgi:SAM-dependent methyltransferase
VGTGIIKNLRAIIGLTPPPAPTRSKMDKRRERFLSTEWTHGADGISRRNYETYENYKSHQASKLALLRSEIVEPNEERTKLFRNSLSLILLKPTSSVLCLAARRGHEVEAFHQLGHFAVGIDLNPGENNPYVLAGDFHAMVFPNASVDCVYTNSLDHTFDISALVNEVKRIVKSSGCFVADIYAGYEEGVAPGRFEALHWKTARGLAEQICVLGNFAVARTAPLSELGWPNWTQFEFRLQ